MLIAATEQTVLDVVSLYLKLGYEHILPKGLDHILFVLVLVFAATRLKPLIWQITAFTAAHTISLALATLGLVAVPVAIVEPIIALSIAFVAIENVVRKEPPRWRPLLVFAFGLFHGLGFAGVLLDLGLPRDQFIPALLSFNVGVELGQLSIILAVWLTFMRFRSAHWHTLAVQVASGLIAALALWWTIERVFLGG